MDGRTGGHASFLRRFYRRPNNHEKCDEGPDLAVDRISDELMHRRGDGGVEDEGDEEEEPEHADDGQGAEDHAGI